LHHQALPFLGSVKNAKNSKIHPNGPEQPREKTRKTQKPEILKNYAFFSKMKLFKNTKKQITPFSI